MSKTTVWADSPYKYVFDYTDVKTVEVELPEGWRRVWTGALKPGDMYLNQVLIQDGIVQWEPVTEFPTVEQMRHKDVGSSADWYGCLIRNDGGPEIEEGCERCKIFHRVKGERFCNACRMIVLMR